MKLIIQIPCYNEEKTLGVTIADLPQKIEGIDVIEYLIINDGSKDNTVKVAKECGVHHVVNFISNKGLAKGFLAGLDACVKLGADIIVNTDADNQYCGADIEKLVAPILKEEADIVIGTRPIDDTVHFSPLKKKLQHLGSWVVRKASHTEVEDAPSGFRAYTKDAAMKMNVFNNYTYTLETIVQAGRNGLKVISVPIRTNPELRKSRLFHSMYGYVKRAMCTIVGAYIMYRPVAVFSSIGTILSLAGSAIGIRFLYLYFTDGGAGHVQSLILASILLVLGALFLACGILAHLAAVNRRLLEDIQYRIKNLENQ